MNELADFEALIDLNVILPKMEENENISKESSQEPLSDVLDKMCETIDADGIGLNAVYCGKDIPLGDKILNLDAFYKILNETRVSDENINSLEKEETILSSGAKVDNENNAVSYRSSEADLNDIADIVKNPTSTAGKLNDDKKEVENIGKEADDAVVNLNEFYEILYDTHVPNVIIVNKEISLSSDAKHIVTHHNSVTDLFEIPNSEIIPVTSEDSYNKVECKISTGEANRKYINTEDSDYAIINLDERQDVLDGSGEENEDMATLVKMEEKTNNFCFSVNNEIINNACSLIADVPITSFINDLKEEKDWIDVKAVDCSVFYNSNKDDKSELNTVLIEEDIEVISISSTQDDFINHEDSDTDDGYNSDDFEFISESEAKKQGPLTNMNVKEFTEDKSSYSDIKYHKNNYIRCIVPSAEANRATRVIPEGESYLNLFRGICAPVVINNLYYMTNKHVLPAKSMSISDGFGFDIPEQREENPEHVAEAAESLKKIRFLYPDENRKRRRRF